MKPNWPWLLISIFFLTSFSAHAATAVTGKELSILVGGGNRPLEATRVLVEAAGGKNARLLVITWASEVKQIPFSESITADLKRHELKTIEYSLHPPQNAAEAEVFLQQLKNSDGVFFSGGKQRRIMKAFDQFPHLKAEVLARYHEGMPIAGTSAGTAMQAQQMIADGGLPLPPIEPGLGLVHDNVLVDTHFFPRSRWKRLNDLVQHYKGVLGVGIDEDGAAIVRGTQHLKVIGSKNVMVIDGLNAYEIRPGDELNLETRVSRLVNPSRMRQCLPCLFLFDCYPAIKIK